MRNYDATILFYPDLREEEAMSALQAVSALIQEKGGIITKSELRGRKPLEGVAGAPRAILAQVLFSAQPEALREAERAVKSGPSVFRASCMLAASRKTVAPSFARTSLPARPKEKEEGQANAEEIDKKLEEILHDPS